MAQFIGQGPALQPGATTVVFTTPFPITVGTRARDKTGNEYVFCDFTGTVNGAQPVAIGSDFTAEPLGLTGRGPVGIACMRGTSDNAGWVQIYGRCYMQISNGSGGSVSPSNEAALTTLGTSAKTLFFLPTTGITSPPTVFYGDLSTDPSLASGIFLEGVNIASDATVSEFVSLVTATTSGSGKYTAHTGAMVAVWINYPNLIHRNYGE